MSPLRAPSTDPNSYAIEVSGLTKAYGHFTAVSQISFEVREKEIFGLLGPNGAGKTTTIKCLLTLAKPTSGTALLYGKSIATEPDQVRAQCGYVPQGISVIRDLTGYENLLISAKMFSVPRSERKKRIDEALSMMDLTEVRDKMVAQYSGGMMRRLEIGCALIHRPKVLFLDEPSIGLDPAGRQVVWEHIRDLREEAGTTVFITTHDMSEADALCDRVAIMNKGKITVIGNPSELKKGLGGDVVTVACDRAREARRVLQSIMPDLKAMESEKELVVVTGDGDRTIPVILKALTGEGIDVSSIGLKRPTLDEVFLRYSGQRMEEAEHEGDWSQTRQRRRMVQRMGQ